MVKGTKSAILGALLGAGVVLAAWSWSGVARPVAAQVQAPRVPASPAASPVVKINPLRKMGHQLMECREQRARETCAAGVPEACAAARAAITADRIFEQIGGGTHDSIRSGPGEDWLDVIAKVDAAMVSCAERVGIFYQRKVW